jgi:hypothetical protein
MSGAQPPGWYPAPGSPAVQRWWDGIRWTGEVREADQPAGADALTARFADSPTVADLAALVPETAPEAKSQAEADAAAAWRAPAVAAWAAKTAPEQPRKLSRWLGRAKRR